MKTIWLVPGWFGLSFGPAPSGGALSGTKWRALVDPRQVTRVVTQWHGRAVSRRQLARLDARMLDDIGLSHDDVDREIRKPFWII